MKRVSPKWRSIPGAQDTAFSLVELLTAIAILSILMLLLSQMIGLASRSWVEGQKRIDNFTKARVTLDLVAQDLQAGIFREDLGAFPDATGTSRKYAFYTQRAGIPASGNTADRNVSLIQYQIINDGPDIHLERADMPVSYATSAGDITFGQTNTLPNLNQITSREASPGIIAMAMSFIHADGTVRAEYEPSFDNPVRAIGVTIAVVDETTQNALAGSNKLGPLVQEFTNLASPIKASVKTLWQEKLDANGFYNQYPAQLRTGLRIFDRYIILPHSVLS